MILNPENVYFTTAKGPISMVEAISMSESGPVEIACLSDDKKTIVYKELSKDCFIPKNKYLYKVTIDDNSLYLDKDCEILTDNGILVKIAYMIHGISLMKDVPEMDVMKIDMNKLYGSATLHNIDHTAYNLPSYNIRIPGFYPIINDIFMM